MRSVLVCTISTYDTDEYILASCWIPHGLFKDMQEKTLLLCCKAIKSFYFTFCWRPREDYEDTIWLLKGKAKKIHNPLLNTPPSHVVPLLYSLSVCFSLFISLFFLNTLPFIQSVCERESRHAESIWRVMSSDRKSFVWRLPRRFMAIYALLLHTHAHTGGHS